MSVNLKERMNYYITNSVIFSHAIYDASKADFNVNMVTLEWWVNWKSSDIFIISLHRSVAINKWKHDGKNFFCGNIK